MSESLTYEQIVAAKKILEDKTSHPTEGIIFGTVKMFKEAFIELEESDQSEIDEMFSGYSDDERVALHSDGRIIRCK